MAATEKSDILKGSWLLQGINDVEQSRGQRRFLVNELSADARSRLNEANDHLASNLSAQHPDDSDIDALYVRSRYWGSTRAFSTVRYGRNRATTPPVDAFAYAREKFYGETRQRQHLRRDPNATESTNSAGLVTIPTVDFDSGTIPLSEYVGSRVEDRAVVQFNVPTIVSSNPRKTLENLYNKKNSDDVVINGQECGRGTLKFLYGDVEPIRKSGSTVYRVLYIFHYRSDGWFTQLLDINTSTSEVTLTRFNLNSVAFADAFPTHDGTGPPAGSSSASGP